MTAKKTFGFFVALMTIAFVGDIQGLGRKKAVEMPQGANSESFDPGPGHQHAQPANKETKKQCLMRCDDMGTSIRASSKTDLNKKIYECKRHCPRS